MQETRCPAEASDAVNWSSTGGRTSQQLNSSCGNSRRKAHAEKGVLGLDVQAQMSVNAVLTDAPNIAAPSSNS